jgi:hypothetical protein
LIWIRAIFVDIQKIEGLVRECVPILQELYNKTKKRLRTTEEVEKYFTGFLAFIDSTEQQISRPIVIKEARYSIQARRKDIL